MIYEQYEDDYGVLIKRTNEQGKIAFIPLDPANSDYAEYLRYEAWVAEGNSPEDFWTQEAGI